MKHFIAMGGDHGCLPDNCHAYKKRKDAVDSMIDLYELSRRQATYLRQNDSVELRKGQGGSYCEVTECNCDSPWEHSEDDSRSDWVEEPCEDDFIVESDGSRLHVSIVGGDELKGPWEDERAIVHAIRKKMDEDKFWPGVWYIDDHGGVTKLRLFKHCWRFVK
jgi:hypothetical protein